MLFRSMYAFAFVSCIVKCQSGGCSNGYKASCHGSFHGTSAKHASWGGGCYSSNCAKGHDKACCSNKKRGKKGGTWKEYKKIITKGEDTIDVKIEIKE